MPSPADGLSPHLAAVSASLRQLLLTKAFRPDRFISLAERFVAAVFGDRFLPQSEQLFDFARIVEAEMRAHTPVLMCSVLGYDASGRVEDLAAELNKPLVSIAIGSAEGMSLCWTFVWQVFLTAEQFQGRT